MNDTRASHTVQPAQTSEDHTFSQTSQASAPDQSQPCVRPPELILEFTADGLSWLASRKTVDVHADWLIRVYGPIFTLLPPVPSRDVSELESVKTKFERSIATHLGTENRRWKGRDWHASTRLRRATARVMEQYREDPDLNRVSVEPRTEMHSFAGSRMTGGGRFRPGFNGEPSHTDYPAAVVYSKYESLLPEDIKQRMSTERLKERSEIATAPPLSE